MAPPRPLVALVCSLGAARAFRGARPALRPRAERCDQRGGRTAAGAFWNPTAAAPEPEEDPDLCDVLADDPRNRPQREALGCAIVPGGLRDVEGPRGRLLQEAKDARMGRIAARRPTVLSHIEALEALNPTPEPLASPLLSGRWRLVYTTSESILGVKRLWPFRPRPRILQHIDAEKLRAKNEEWVLGGLLRNSVRAKLEPRGDGRTVDVQFRRFGIGWLKLPAPKSARGVLETTYLDNEMRISRGDKGNLFVLVRDSAPWRGPI